MRKLARLVARNAIFLPLAALLALRLSVTANWRPPPLNWRREPPELHTLEPDLRPPLVPPLAEDAPWPWFASPLNAPLEEEPRLRTPILLLRRARHQMELARAKEWERRGRANLPVTQPDPAVGRHGGETP